MKRKLAAGLFVVGAATLSCQVIMGLHDPEGNPAPPTEAGLVDSGPNDPCHHAVPPPPPSKDDDPDTKKTFWFATEHITLPLLPDAGVQPGFDLDNACTCSPDLHDGGPSCITPGASTRTFCDYEGGIDDGFGASILGTRVDQFIDVTKPANTALADGTRTLLLYLTDYNDKANDQDVSVQFIDSGGLYSDLDCNGSPAGHQVTPVPSDVAADAGLPGPRYAPLNLGCDRWSPNLGLTTGAFPNRIPGQTISAYVSNYTVVVKYNQLSGSIFGGASTITDGIAVAHITTENGIHHADGLFSGRIPFAGLVDLMARTPVSDGDGGQVPFCDSDLYALVNGFACKAVDTMSSSSEDFKNQNCDATSVQFTFQLVEAQVDDVAYTNASQGLDCSHPTPPCN